MQRALDRNGGGERRAGRRPPARPLDGLLFDARGRAMKPTHASRSARAVKGAVRKRDCYCASRADGDAPATRIPAEGPEGFVATTLLNRLGDASRLSANFHQSGVRAEFIAAALERAGKLVGEADGRSDPLVDLIERVHLGAGSCTIFISSTSIAGTAEGNAPPTPIRIEAPLRIRRAGRSKPIVIGLYRGGPKPKAAVIAMLADARRWASELLSCADASVGEIERDPAPGMPSLIS